MSLPLHTIITLAQNDIIDSVEDSDLLPNSKVFFFTVEKILGDGSRYIEFEEENKNLLHSVFQRAYDAAVAYMRARPELGRVVYYRISFGGQRFNVDEQLGRIVQMASEYASTFSPNPLNSIINQVNGIVDMYADQDDGIHTLTKFTITAVGTELLYIPSLNVFTDEEQPRHSTIERGYFDVCVNPKKGVLFSPGTYKNCLYQAAAFGNNPGKWLQMLSEIPEDEKQRVKAINALKVALTKVASDIKAHVIRDNNVPEEIEYYTLNILEAIAEECKRPIYTVDYKLKPLHKAYPKQIVNATPMFIQMVTTSSSVHAVAVIPKDVVAALKFDITKIYSSVPNEKKFELNRNMYDSNQLIKKEESAEKTVRFVTYDYETYFKDAQGNHINHTPYTLGICWGTKKDEDKYIQFKQFSTNDTYNCTEQFWTYILNNWDYYVGTYFFAHNGAKFDSLLAIQEIPSCLTIFKTITQEGAIISFKVCQSGIPEKDRNKNCITFRDSMRLFPGSLEKLCKDLDVEMKKLTMDYQAVNTSNYKEYAKKVEEYLLHDCLGLYQVLEKMQKDCPGILAYATASSAALASFFKEYYNPEKYPLYRLSDEIDGFIRGAYSGGRVEAYILGLIIKQINMRIEDEEITDEDELGLIAAGRMNQYLELLKRVAKRLYYYDINSLYPYAGTKRLPYGKPYVVLSDLVDKQNITAFHEFLDDIDEDSVVHGPEKVFDEKGKIKEDFYGFIQCYVTGPTEGVKPLHSIKEEGKLLFPKCNFTLMSLFSEEVRLAQELDLGYEYLFVQGVGMQAACHHEKFYNDNYNDRLKHKEAGEEALSLIKKLRMNSEYGKWGIKVLNRDSITFERIKTVLGDTVENNVLTKQFRDKIIKNMYNGSLKGWLQFKDYIILRKSERLKINNNNVAIATAIVTYGRMENYLWQMQCLQNNINVYYTDTDSLITDRPITWNVGEKLGQIKNEAEEMVSDALTPFLFPEKSKAGKKLDAEEKEILKQAVLKEVSMEENGILGFDNGIILGPKNYALIRKFLHPDFAHLKPIVKMTCKGIKKKGASIIKAVKSDGNEIIYDPPQPLSWSHYEIMSEGGVIYQDQERFVSGKTTIMDAKDPVVIRMDKITKMCKMSYNKGNWDKTTNIISPKKITGYKNDQGIFVIGEIKPLQPPEFILYAHTRSEAKKNKRKRKTNQTNGRVSSSGSTSESHESPNKRPRNSVSNTTTTRVPRRQPQNRRKDAERFLDLEAGVG